MKRGIALLVALLAGMACAAEEPPCPVAAANLFPSQSWQPPPPPPRPPEPPRAPPLPFAYLGQLDEGGSIALFLGKQQRTLVVRAGDTIDGSYRIDSITPQRAMFTYLPLDIQQPLILRNKP